MAGVRVPEAQPGQIAVQAAPRVMQRETRDGAGRSIANAVQGFGQTLGAVAQEWDARLAKVDEARVMEMDTEFGDWERGRLRGDDGFLRQTGKNAMTALDGAVEDFDARQKAQLEAVENDRQREMLVTVQARRRERYMDQVQGHVAAQTEKYWDDSFSARVGSLSNDIAAAPLDPDRLPQMLALGAMYDDYGARKGWDRDMIETARRDAFTTVHKGSVATLLEAGDPTQAAAYLDQWAPQIEAGALTQLRGIVREQVDLFEADAFANGPANAAPPAPTVAAADGTGEPFTLRAPVSATVGSAFGPRRRPAANASSSHGGVDYPVPVSTPVAAAGPGKVIFAGEQGNYGNLVIIDHGDGYQTRYAHLSRIDVAVGDSVPAGRTVALSGGARGTAGAGNSTGPHLHFETRRNGQAVDPDDVLGEVSVRGGRGGAAQVAQPRTLEDAYEAADAAAGPNADWRRRAAFRQAGAARYQRDQSFEADRERHAADAVAPYLPYGASAAASYTDIPLAIRQGLSPQQDTQIRGIFAREAEAAGGQNDDATMNALLDIRVYDPARFNTLDLTQYADKLSNSTFNSMLQAQRESRTRPVPESQTVRGVAASSLVGTDDMVGRLIKSAGMEGDEMARAELRAYVLQAAEAYVTRTGEAPDEQRITGYFMQGMREFEVTDGRGRRERVRAFEVDQGVQGNLVIPPRDRGDVVRRLREPPYNLRNPSSRQVQDFYNRGLLEGLYTAPNLRRR